MTRQKWCIVQQNPVQFFTDKSLPKEYRPEFKTTVKDLKNGSIDLDNDPYFKTYSYEARRVKFKELQETVLSGEVEAYCTEYQFEEFKKGGADKKVPFEGVSSDTRPYENYVTKLDEPPSDVGSLGKILGTNWKEEDVGKIYKGTFPLDDSTIVGFSSGNEVQANPDWISVGRTLNSNNKDGLGELDLVITNYPLNPSLYETIN